MNNITLDVEALKELKELGELKVKMEKIKDVLLDIPLHEVSEEELKEMKIKLEEIRTIMRNIVKIDIPYDKETVIENLLEKKEEIMEAIINSLAQGDRVFVEYYNKHVLIHRISYLDL